MSTGKYISGARKFLTKRETFVNSIVSYSILSTGGYRTPHEKFETDDGTDAGNADGVTFGHSKPWKSMATKGYWTDMLVGCIGEIVATAIFLYAAILVNQTGDVYAIAFGAGGTIGVLVVSFAKIR